jgi:hypothetical protein
MKRTALLLTAAASLLLAGAAPQTAGAAIKCRGPDQLVGGRWISTPYCQDNYIAYVAGTYGIRVSAVSVRQNPSVKSDICRQIGHDIRIKSYCAGYLPEDDSPVWR